MIKKILLFFIFFFAPCFADQIDKEDIRLSPLIVQAPEETADNMPITSRQTRCNLIKGFVLLSLGVTVITLPLVYFLKDSSVFIETPCKDMLKDFIYDGKAQVNFTVFPDWDDVIYSNYICDFAHNMTNKVICCLHTSGDDIPTYLSYFSASIKETIYMCLPFAKSWSIFSGFSSV